MENRHGTNPVIRMNGLRPTGRVLVKTLAGPLPDMFISRVRVDYLRSFSVHHPKDFAYVLRQLPELLLALSQRLFRLLSLSQIEEEAYGFSAGGPHRCETHQGRKMGTILADVFSLRWNRTPARR